MNRREFFASSAAMAPAIFAAEPSSRSSKPKVRAITAFTVIDRTRFQSQIAATLKRLRTAKQIAEAGGYQIEGVRIVTQPFPALVNGLSREESLRFFREYDALAATESFNANIGPAMMDDTHNPDNARLLGEILSTTKSLGASIVTAGENGIYWKCISAAAMMVKFVQEHSAGSAGNFNFATTAMLAPYAPFYPGAYHAGPGDRFAIGLESANLVDQVFAVTKDDVKAGAEQLQAAISEHAVSMEKLAVMMGKETGWTYMGLDPTPAPLREVSIGAAIEKFTGAKFGSSGTMTAAAVITRAVQATPVKRIGYSGLMLPILEDTVLAERWTEGTYSLDSLLAYSAVCGTGLDTIPMAGEVTVRQLTRIMGDVATLAYKWKKPLSARLLPISGKRVGDRTALTDGFLVNSVIQPIR
jgi:uncharacterized protein